MGLLDCEVSLELADLASPLATGCIITRPKQKNAITTSGAPIISPRISSLCSICNELWLKYPPEVSVEHKNIT